jgi:hypothetical protein
VLRSPASRSGAPLAESFGAPADVRARATPKRGAGHMEVATQDHMAGHEPIKCLLDGDKALSDGGRVTRIGVLAIKR